MKKFFLSGLLITSILLVIGAGLYFRAQAQCAPIIQERMQRGYDNAPTLCGGEFYFYLPVAVITWLIWVVIALFRMIAQMMNARGGKAPSPK